MTWHMAADYYDIDYYDWAMRHAPAIGSEDLPGLRAAYFRGVKDCREGRLYPHRGWPSQTMQDSYEAGFYNELWEQSD